MNLLEHFYRIHNARRGGLLAALEALNAELGTKHSNNTLARWRRAAIPVPQAVQTYMRAIVLRDIQQANQGRFTLSVLREITDACKPPSAEASTVARPRSFFASCGDLPSQGFGEF